MIDANARQAARSGELLPEEEAQALRRHLREGVLEPRRLQLLAYLDYPPALLAFEPEPYEEDEGPPRLAIEERWKEILACSRFGSLFDGASRVGALRRLWPYVQDTEHPIDIRLGWRRAGFSHCTSEPFVGSGWMEVGLGRPYGITDPSHWESCIPGVRPGPTWLGGGGARMSRCLMAGGLIEPSCAQEWLEALDLWGPGIAGRAWLALAQAALPDWTDASTDTRPQQALEAAWSWLDAPVEHNLVAVRAGAGRAKVACFLSEELRKGRAARAARFASNACLTIMREPRLLLSREDLDSLAETRRTVALALVPWLSAID